MVLGVRAIPFTFVAHVLAILGLVFVLVWTLDFRGGLAWEATKKSLIFNVSFSNSLFLGLSLLLLGSVVFVGFLEGFLTFYHIYIYTLVMISSTRFCLVVILWGFVKL